MKIKGENGKIVQKGCLTLFWHVCKFNGWEIKQHYKLDSSIHHFYNFKWKSNYEIFDLDNKKYYWS